MCGSVVHQFLRMVLIFQHALIEEDDAVVFGIKEPSTVRKDTPTRSSVYEYDRITIRVTPLLQNKYGALRPPAKKFMIGLNDKITSEYLGFH